MERPMRMHSGLNPPGMPGPVKFLIFLMLAAAAYEIAVGLGFIG